jgi:hypothetical protein
VILPDANQLSPVRLRPVPQSEAVAASASSLPPGKADRWTSAGAVPGVAIGGKGAPEVDRGLLEDLRRDLTAPREARDALGDRPINGHDEDAASVLASLPGVERVDEVEPRPWNRQ